LEESRERDDAEESSNEQSVIGHALMTACRFKHTDVALRLLERSIALDPELGRRIDRWQRSERSEQSEGRKAFVEFLAQQPGVLWRESGTPWETFVVLQLGSARDRNDLPGFRRWLDDEPWVLQRSFTQVQTELMLPACYEK